MIVMQKIFHEHVHHNAHCQIIHSLTQLKEHVFQLVLWDILQLIQQEYAELYVLMDNLPTHY